MKNKTIIIILTILFVLSLSASVIGIIEHNKNKETTPENEITYEYYIDGIKQDKIPENTLVDEENNITLYKFSKFECSNNKIEGSFDTEKWKFITSSKESGVCRLYFVNNYYDVDITVTNGKLDETNTKKVERENDGQFVIIPNDGYEFKEVNCSNNKVATYDKSTNTLTVSVVTENIACKVDFDLKLLTMELKVKNGEGATKEETDYGNSISVIVTPKDGYQKPKVTCTNNQEAVIKDNTLTIQKLTNNTVCTVTYSAIPVKKYTLKINIPEQVNIVSGDITQKIQEGKDALFTIKAKDGYEISDINCGDVVPNKEEQQDGSIYVSLLKMSKDLTCTVSAKEKTQEVVSTGE